MSRGHHRHHGQRGQALIEAAFAVPIMVLMVFGTFYITYAYMQRSMMNGAAFMAARAVSVRPPGEADNLAKTVVVRMAQNAKLGDGHWLNRAPVSGHPTEGVRLEEPDGMWSFLARMADITAGGEPKKQKVAIRLSPEFRRLAVDGRAPQSYRIVSYSVNEAPGYDEILTLPIIKQVLKTDPDERIGEPDNFQIDPTHINGGVDSLGGTQYDRNTAKLGKHKWQIGLRATAPEDNDSDPNPTNVMLPATSRDGHLARLQMIGRLFDGVDALGNGLDLLMKELAPVKAFIGPAYQQIAAGRDAVLDKGLTIMQEQQTLALSPGAD
jgi:hypothetical protein